MKIKNLEPGMRGMFVDGTIVDLSEPRTINTRNGPRSVADATLEDKTGRIKLSLWEDMIEKVHVGDEVTISGAYVKEFRGELQLNISRSGTLETQDDRIAEWIGQVKGWISEDIENFREEASDGARRESERTSYGYVYAHDLTVEELAESKLSDDNFRFMNTLLLSNANKEYAVGWVAARKSGDAVVGDPTVLLNGLDGDEEDFSFVEGIFAGEAKSGHSRAPTQRDLEENLVRFDLRENPTPTSIVNFYEKNRMHFGEVRLVLTNFQDVPKQDYQNSGLPPAKLSHSKGYPAYIDDDNYEQYVKNTALENLLKSFPHAAGRYRGGEEGFLYYYEDAGAVPKGIEWMNEEAQGWPSSVVKRKVREMGEAYKQVIEEVVLRKKGLAPIKTEREPIALTPPEFGVEDLPSGWQLGGDPPFRAWPDGLYSGYRRAFHLRDPARTRAISGEGEDLDLTVMLFGDVSSATDYYAVQRREDLTATGEVYKSPAAENETTDEDGTYCSFEHPFAERGRRTFWFVKGIKGNVYYSYILEKWRPKTWTRTIRRSVSAEPAFPLLDIRQTLVGRIELS